MHYSEIQHISTSRCPTSTEWVLGLCTFCFLHAACLCVSYSTLMSFSQYSNFQMFSNDIFDDKICANLPKSGCRKNGYKFEFEFQIFVQRQVRVMDFQGLCLLCYETQRLRHSEAVCVAQFLLWQGVQLVPISWCPCTRFAKFASQRPFMAR